MSQFYKLESYDERSFCYAYEDCSVKGIQSFVCNACGSFEWNRQRLSPLFLDESTKRESKRIPVFLQCIAFIKQSAQFAPRSI